MNFKNDMRGKLPNLPWGSEVIGTFVLMCDECETVRKKQIDESDNGVLAEGIGDNCPTCEKITTNWLLDLLPLQSMEDWY